MAQPWSPEGIDDLVGRLTLEQKVGQLVGIGVTDLYDQAALAGGVTELVFDRAKLARVRPHGLGHISMGWFVGTDAESMRSGFDSVQELVREVSPFGIGAMVHNEALSGFLHPSGSQFPTGWAHAATWRPELAYRAARVSAAHMQESGMHIAFSPVMDVARDPRWGRVHETFGEDPELAAQFSVAFVQGIQGRDGETGVLATGKHFLGYASSEAAYNKAATHLGRRTLTDEYAEPFRRAIAEAGLEAVMNSYNEIDGIPSAANRWLLTELLRDQLGFEGLTVSDYDSVAMLTSVYHTAANPGAAAVQAISAGLDVELPGGDNYLALVQEVEAGRVAEDTIDRAVTRVLRAKAKVGLIPEFRGTRTVDLTVDREEAEEVRHTIADEAIVLLKNDGTLPLEAGRRRVVVVGPAAEELRIHFASYTSVAGVEMPMAMVAIMTGEVPGIDPATFIFTDLFQAKLPGMDSKFEQISHDMHPEARTIAAAIAALDPEARFVALGSFDGSDELTDERVIAAVGDADIVIAALGERTGWAGNNTAGEGQTTAEIGLPGDQHRLVELLARTGAALVSVLISGRPLLIGDVAERSNALLLAPLLGEEGGRAVADALYGVTNPGGKLPNGFPRSIGQIPQYHGHHYGSGYDHPTGPAYPYNDLETDGPLFAFAHGLSYTSFELHAGENGIRLEGESVVADVLLRNTGDREGDAVVQLYGRDEVASIVRPVRQLLAFERARLAAGEERLIRLTAPLQRLVFTAASGVRLLEAGDVTFHLGFASDDLVLQRTLTVPEITSPAPAPTHSKENR